ncbi:Unconventional myosin-XVIIIa like protein [Argiope bruennichi]|uniref:Unconventional myosin-XVIIIa like protein n=1 Tax=Argiope bruennichi TaxID=94029 RepID=A0A8T0F544_ARGBR|nr:Unconventional myosin-XVIIIa like protein [Argiope bruennichi]
MLGIEIYDAKYILCKTSQSACCHQCPTDIHKTNIEVLLEADIAGKLITGRREELETGLETKLGWTLMGKVPRYNDKKDTKALKDVNEERQIANQWKRKAQKCVTELQDLRLMLEEQMARNGELENKQRLFDAELKQDLQSVKLDADKLHEKIAELTRELDELTLSNKDEEEVTHLERVKQNLLRKFRDQEDNWKIIKGKDKINAGDIVLIGIDDKKRLHWLLGRVLELFPGKDGIIRLVRLRIEKGNIRRPTTVPFGIDTKLRASRIGNSEASGNGN